MPTTAIHTWTNVTFVAADATKPIGQAGQGGPYYVPDGNGVAVPAGKVSWALNVDQSNVPANQSYRFGIEYQRLAQWTDKAGIVHPAGEWLPDYASTISGGSISLRNGASTVTNHISSSIGAKDSQGAMVEPYPNNVRVRVESMQGWLFPTISLTMS